jgi:hypothetical protein
MTKNLMLIGSLILMLAVIGCGGASTETETSSPETSPDQAEKQDIKPPPVVVVEPETDEKNAQAGTQVGWSIGGTEAEDKADVSLPPKFSNHKELKVCVSGCDDDNNWVSAVEIKVTLKNGTTVSMKETGGKIKWKVKKDKNDPSDVKPKQNEPEFELPDSFFGELTKIEAKLGAGEQWSSYERGKVL